MKGIGKILIGLVIGLILGWAAAFYVSPFSFKKASFIIGLLTASTLITLFYFLKFSKTKKQTSGQTTALLGAFISVLLFITLTYIILRSEKLINSKNTQQKEQAHKTQALLEANQNKDDAYLMNSIIKEVAEEVKNNPQRSLSPKGIDRLLKLSKLLKPYYIVEGDSLSGRKYNPETGKLIMTLTQMGIDTSSFQKMISTIPFNQTMLSGAQLQNVNFEDADLKKSNFIDADLQGANLNRADLREADFYRCNLKEAQLVEANLMNAKLSWANLEKSNCQKIILKGVDIRNANFSRLQAHKANLNWSKTDGASMKQSIMTETKMSMASCVRTTFNEADLSNSFLRATDFTEANFIGTNLQGADLAKVILTRADLSNANLMGTILDGAKMNNVLLDGAKVSADWFAKLVEWKVEEAVLIQDSYALIKNADHYLLKLKN